MKTPLFLRRCRHGPKLLLLGIGVLAALLLLELSCRIATRFSVNIAYLTQAGVTTDPVARSLSEFIAQRPTQIEPRRLWRNSRANSLGFYDGEFTHAPSAGTFRILAVGDSFTFGLVPFDDNVVERVEKGLQARCARPIEIYNFGVPGATLLDYRNLIGFLAKDFRFDALLLNIYLGNDVPDGYRDRPDIVQVRQGSRHSYLWRFLVNLWILRTSTNEAPSARLSQRTVLPAQSAVEIRDDQPPMSVPTYTQEAWVKVLGDELLRFHRGPGTAYRQVAGVLRDIKQAVEEAKAELWINFYPSRLQVESSLLAEVLPQLNEVRIKKGRDVFKLADFDLGLPNRQLTQLCVELNLRCFDTSGGIAKAAQAQPARFYIPRDPHWNIAGNHLAATVQLEQLQQVGCEELQPR